MPAPSIGHAMIGRAAAPPAEGCCTSARAPEPGIAGRCKRDASRGVCARPRPHAAMPPWCPPAVRARAARQSRCRARGPAAPLPRHAPPRNTANNQHRRSPVPRAPAQVFLSRTDPISIAEISEITSITTADIISTLQHLGLVKYYKGPHAPLPTTAERRLGLRAAPPGKPAPNPTLCTIPMRHPWERRTPAHCRRC